MVTQSAFPKVKKRTKRNPARARRPGQAYAQSLNALHPCHLALPRAVGGYSIIRTTQIVTSSNTSNLFGLFKGPGTEFTETCWLDLVGVSNAPFKFGDPINDTLGAQFFTNSPLNQASLNGARMVPAAMTVQVMNPNALQTTSGIIYIGRSKTVLDLMGNTRTWVDLMQELVSYSAPRLCSAGKLALRGVQVNAVPNNLSVLSDFVPRRIVAGSTSPKTWTEAATPVDFEGFGPIFVYNPESVPLQYLVTVEWRMRFDPLNPAYAGHIMHPPASESTWHKVISDAEAAGNGVHDIAEVVADAGVALGGAAAAAAPFFV